MTEHRINGFCCRIGPCKSRSIFVTDLFLVRDTLVDDQGKPLKCCIPNCRSNAYFHCGWDGLRKLKQEKRACCFVVYEFWMGIKLIFKSNYDRIIDALPNALDEIKKKLKEFGGNMADSK